MIAMVKFLLIEINFQPKYIYIYIYNSILKQILRDVNLLFSQINNVNTTKFSPEIHFCSIIIHKVVIIENKTSIYGIHKAKQHSSIIYIKSMYMMN